MTLGKDFTMWDDDPEMMDAFEDYDEDYDYEGESDDYLSELGFDSVLAADTEDEAFDKEGEDFDDED